MELHNAPGNTEIKQSDVGSLSSPPLQPALKNYHIPDREKGLADALRGGEIHTAEGYQVYTDFRTSQETVVFVHDPSDSKHKYLFAHTEDHTYIVAAPVGWIEYHKHLLKKIQVAINDEAYCSGGGFVAVTEDGRLVVDGSSTDFGRGDHSRAKKAFDRAYKARHAGDTSPL